MRETAGVAGFMSDPSFSSGDCMNSLVSGGVLASSFVSFVAFCSRTGMRANLKRSNYLKSDRTEGNKGNEGGYAICLICGSLVESAALP